jgi:hypothetical protein
VGFHPATGAPTRSVDIAEGQKPVGRQRLLEDRDEAGINRSGARDVERCIADEHALHEPLKLVDALLR